MPFPIEAKLWLLKTEEGGRKTPFHTGYRPGFHLREGHQFSGAIKLLDRHQLFPGEEAVVHIEFAFPQLTADDVAVGKEILFGEGTRVLGRVLVLKAF